MEELECGKRGITAGHGWGVPLTQALGHEQVLSTLEPIRDGEGKRREKGAD